MTPFAVNAACFLLTILHTEGLHRKLLPFTGLQQGGMRDWSTAESMAQNTLKQLSTLEKISLLRGVNSYKTDYYVGNTPAIERMRIPALKLHDASNGFRPTTLETVGSTTCFPSMLALASTWDEWILGAVGRAMAAEFRGKGANVLLGPSVNVHRSAANGRNFEYLSGEDPYLGSRLVRPFIQGAQSQGVIATAKHFAFNEQETLRTLSNSVVDEKTAYELYYPPFEAAVEAGVGAFMCAYNKVNGTYACQSDELLQRDLRGRMGFKGFVMSDWGAVHDASALYAGMDQEMPGMQDTPNETYYFHDDVLRQMKAPAIDDAATRILAALYRVGIDTFDECVPPCHLQLSSNQRSEEHSRLAQFAAARSIVLLKNDDILPLDSKRTRTIGIMGAAAFIKPTASVDLFGDYYSGGGSGHVSSRDLVSVFDGISRRAAISGINVTAPKTPEEIMAADVIIFVGATTSGEGVDRQHLHLDGEADADIQRVALLRPTIVLMITPGAVLTPWREYPQAIMNMFLGGERTGSAFAGVLFGDTFPTGKLPIMFPATDDDVIWPSASENGTEDVPYSEGLFTSYRSTVLKSAYPFGFGLTYTNFTYGVPSLNLTCTGLNISFLKCVDLPVYNSGSRPGVEIAQAYAEFPSATGYPARVLRGFQKTGIMQPGERKIVQFPFTPRDLSIYDVDQGWVVQRDVRLHFGSSSVHLHSVLSDS